MSIVGILFFMSSGLFLGWSLGANDAANIFGTAVGSRMIRFSTAAIICSLFLIIGASTGGAAAHTLNKLGTIHSLGGAFTIVLSSALSVFFMTRLSLPVSSSQAIIGGIIGANLFSGASTDFAVFTKIISTWVGCPFLAMCVSAVLYVVVRFYLRHAHIHIFRLDAYTRWGLIFIGAIGAFNLGSNGVASVMGVFVPASPFKNFDLFGVIHVASSRQLFFIGGLAMAVGVVTYSKKVMMTVGSNIFVLSPILAFVAVTSCSLVLFLFSSKGLYNFLVAHHIPPIPLVPVSSSQASVGAVMGIGIVRSAKNVNYRILGKIALGWVVTPILAGLISYILLFFMRNVFLIDVS